MATAQKTAHVTWHGSLFEGSGEITKSGSGALPRLPVSWSDRTGEGTATSPEELIAAAHAACFSMALSNGLASEGHPPERLEVDATCTFETGDGGARIASARLRVSGAVPGLDEAGFRAAAEGAKANCPVSKALGGSVEITLEGAILS
jgi:osmotically inducible protein OsmC